MAHDSTVRPEHLLALFAAKDLEALIDAVFPVLQSVVRCTFATAFYRSAGKGLLKERDSRGRQYGPAFMRRFVELTPALPVALANPGIKTITTRSCLPPRPEKLRRSALYREIMQMQGWRHGVALCFWGEPRGEAPVFVTSVYRTEGQPDFSEQDVATLERIHPFIDGAVNRLHEREAAMAVRDGMAMAVQDATRGLAILNANLHLVEANPIARQLCAAWIDDASPADTVGQSAAWRLPQPLAAACREMHAEYQALVRSDPDALGIRRRRVAVHARVPGLMASIALVFPHSTSLGEPTFVIEVERRVHGVALATPDRSAPVLQQLTESERAVAMVLSDGLSNQEIADHLGKTVNAVKFLLHRIYQKTGVPSRAALVAVLRSRQSPARKRQQR